MNLYDTIRRFSMLSYILFYGITILLDSPFFTLAAQIMLLVSVLLTFPTLSRTNLIVAIMLALSGFSLLLFTEVPPEEWLGAFFQNGAITAIFITIPMLSIPFSFGDYREDLKHFIQKYVSSPMVFCLITWILAHLFGVIILIGVVPLMFNLLYENSKLYGADKEFASCVSHAQLSGGFWSPAWSAVVVITYTLSIPWISFVPAGLLLTTIFFVFSMLFIFISLKRSGAHRIACESEVQVNWKGVIMILTLTILPILLIILSTTVMNIAISTAIPIVALLYPLFTALILREGKEYRTGMAEYYTTRVLNVKNELALLTTAGFLGRSLQLAGADSVITHLLPGVSADHAILTILSILLIFFVTAHLGMHPIVAGSALAVSINPASIGFTPLMFGIVLLSGWVLGTLISPFSASNIVISGMIGKPSWYLSARRHGLFTLFMALLLTWVMSLLSHLI